MAFGLFVATKDGGLVLLAANFRACISATEIGTI
jgi:hypothetical protein